MMFLFGALVGTMLASGDTAAMMGQGGFMGIPLRCMYVTSEQAYRDCRKLSMQREMLAQSTYDPATVGQCYYHWAGRAGGRIIQPTETDCNWSHAITLEIEALKALNAILAVKR